VEKSVDLTLQLPDSLPEIVCGDSVRFRQILVNLTSNAVKFTGKGWIHVTAKVVGETTDVWNIRFSVTDTGIGISPDQQRLLFEPFIQADPTITRKYGGTGLGLALSRRLARLMGGDMGVDSEFEEGSTFWLTLPLGKAALSGKDEATAP
jgi:signal transduction histidine kinase